MSSKQSRTNTAARIIAKFGGIRPMATIIDRPHSTVQSWEVSGYIPARQQENILKVAREKGIDVSPADFFDTSTQAAE